MGKYPVISISLKGINAAAYEDAFDFAVQIMQRTAEEFQFLSDSEYLSEHDKSVYRELLDSNMSETVFCGGLKILSKLLEKHYRLKVIRLTLYILKNYKFIVSHIYPFFRDYEEKSVNKIFYDNDRRKIGMKSAFRLCFIYNSYKIACQERAGNPPVFLTFFIIPVSVPHT